MVIMMVVVVTMMMMMIMMEEEGKEEKKNKKREEMRSRKKLTLSISLVSHSSIRFYAGFTQPITMVHRPAFGSHNILVHSYTQARA